MYKNITSDICKSVLCFIWGNFAVVASWYFGKCRKYYRTDEFYLLAVFITLPREREEKIAFDYYFSFNTLVENCFSLRNDKIKVRDIIDNKMRHVYFETFRTRTFLTYAFNSQTRFSVYFYFLFFSFRFVGDMNFMMFSPTFFFAFLLLFFVAVK